MKLKHFIQALGTAILTAAFSSCSPDAEYTKTDTSVSINLCRQLPNMLQFELIPADSKVYYAVDCIAVDSLKKWGLSGKQLMDKILSEQYDLYEQIRQTMEWDSQPYGGTFADHSLYYASAKVQFTDLDADAWYRLIVFCVDPDSRIPVGNIQSKDFKTMDINDCPESDINLKFMVKTVSDALRIYFKPLNSEGGISSDYYVTGYLISEDELKSKYDGDIRKYVDYELEYMLENKLSTLFMYSDIRVDWYPDFSTEYEIGKTYIIWACPYSTDYAENIYTLTFKLEQTMDIDYTNDFDLNN